MRAQGIHHRLITPYYSEGNGKAEAFVKILKHEYLNRRFATIEELEHALAEFVVYYNHFRLHGSLDCKTPVVRYLGIETVADHGLTGISFLPDELSVALPPSRPAEVPTVNARAIKRRFALARPSLRAACPERLNCVELVEGERSAVESRNLTLPALETLRLRYAPLRVTDAL